VAGIKFNLSCYSKFTGNQDMNSFCMSFICGEDEHKVTMMSVVGCCCWCCCSSLSVDVLRGIHTYYMSLARFL
jgi:hypothetical protein